MQRNSLLAGMLATAGAGTLFATMDATSKHLTSLIPVLQVVWGRYFFHTAIIAVVLLRTTGFRFLRTRRPALQLLRGAMLLITTGLMYAALSRAPLADVTATMFFAPILVTLLSVVFLKEKIGIHRIAAIVVGFVGVLLLVRPGSAGLDPFLLFALFAALTNATYLLLTRQLAGQDDAAATQFNTTAVGAVLLSFLVVTHWETPAWSTLALMVMAGSLGALGHYVLVMAFARAPASLLSPFLYSQVLFAGIWSVAIFGDPLRATTLLGAALLVGSGLYIWWRENR